MFIFKNRNLFLPGDDDETVALKRRFLNFLAPAPFGLTLIGVVLWLSAVKTAAMGLWIFSAISLLIFIAFYLIRDHVRWFAAITLYFYVFFSFAAVLYFGGILHSGGVVLVGLAGALFSLSFLSARQFRILFVVYLLSVIIEALLQPFLTPQPELSPTVNLTLFVLHILVIAMVMFYTISYYIKQSIQTKQKEADRLKELDTIKTRFYTNITHEFRTPLTVIIGMADQIGKNRKDYLETDLQLVRRNGVRLLHLVNQMLDLSKIEAGTMSLHFIQGDIIKYLRYISESFERMAEEKNIHFHFMTEYEEMKMDFDPEKIEKLIGNLLSNAIKYSPEDSEIYFRIDVTNEIPGMDDHSISLFQNRSKNQPGKKIRFIIQDTGLGIRHDQLGRIFERFYQVNGDLTRQSEGSGIGLSLVKELVNLMNGDLFLQSIHGEGTKFTVYLPVTNNAPVESIAQTDLDNEFYGRHSLENEEINERWSFRQNLPHLLVIEDNPDVVHYVRTVLENEFQIEVAGNGKEGIEKALGTIPDAIISDIMMPEKDGYEVCRVLKSDFRTSHIPIVMLTAKADTESMITGLEYGADAYLVKPFNNQELRVRLHKLIELREKLKAKYRLMAIDPSPADPPLNPDEMFINKIKNVLSDHAHDENFDNKQLCDELGLSRVQLFRKLKSITGQSSSQLIRYYRLNKARELILSTNLNVSEVAYDVGFKDPAYFTRAFTKEFGVTPTSLRADQRE